MHGNCLRIFAGLGIALDVCCLGLSVAPSELVSVFARFGLDGDSWGSATTYN